MFAQNNNRSNERENLCKPKAMKFTSMVEVTPSFGKLKQILYLN